MNLAARLAASEINLRDAENRVEALLDQLFPGWKGWKFTSPSGLDVYHVTDTADALTQLHARGFSRVVLHSHGAERFLSCECRPSLPAATRATPTARGSR